MCHTYYTVFLLLDKDLFVERNDLFLQTLIGLVECYYEVERNFVTGLRRLYKWSGLGAGPCFSTFQLTAKFKATTSVMRKNLSGKPSVITDIVVAKVLQATQGIMKTKILNI